jgi:hypothetical protein
MQNSLTVAPDTIKFFVKKMSLATFLKSIQKISTRRQVTPVTSVAGHYY